MADPADTISDDIMSTDEPAAKAEVPKRGRGRPAGSKNKTKELLTAPLRSPAPQTIENTPEDVDVSRAIRDALDKLDFESMGSADRWLILLVRDTSPSEQPYEMQFHEGANAIGPVLAGDRLAANLVDVGLCYGAEDFKVIDCQHAKNFVMPQHVEYGKGTAGAPWFRASPACARTTASTWTTGALPSVASSLSWPRTSNSETVSVGPYWSSENSSMRTRSWW